VPARVNATIRGQAIHVVALAVYAVVILATLGWIHPGRELWGANTSDVFNHLHLLHWQAAETLQGRLYPTYDALLHHPDGGVLFLADLVGQPLALPLVWLAGPVVAANALIFGNLLFACWAMFWLVRRSTGDPWAAMVAGLAFGLSPINLGHVNNGVWELLQCGWLPLFAGCVLALFGVLREPVEGRRWRNAACWAVAAAAAWIAAALGSHWYYGMYGGFLLVGLVIAHAFGPGRLRKGLWSLGIVAGFLAVVLPVIRSFLSFTHSPLALTRGLAPGSWTAEKATDLAYVFAARPTMFEMEFIHLTYLGFVLPIALVALCVVVRKRWALVAWIGGGVFFLLLSLGPIIVLSKEAVELGPVAYLLPHHWLSAIVPRFESMEFPYRLFVLVHLCFAAALGLGLARARWAGRERWFRGVVLGIGALLWLETLLFSGAPVPMFTQSIAPAGPVAALSGETGAVFDLPISADIRARNRYVVNQLFHGRPILHSNFPTSELYFTGSLSRDSLATHALMVGCMRPCGYRTNSWEPRGEQLAPLEIEVRAARLRECLLTGGPCDDALLDELQWDLERMRAAGIVWIVLHRDLLAPESPLPQLCHALFGEPSMRSDDVDVYRL
jgi:hypothetical protein